MSEQETGSASGASRIVLVTGAASGIGAASVRRAAGAGVKLLLHTRKNEPALAAVADAARAAGSDVDTMLGDLGEKGLAQALVERAVKRFGGLDQIVANAGHADRRPFGEVDMAAMEQSLAIMPRAFFETVTAALEPLKASRWGRVVAVSSFVAHSFGLLDRVFPVTAAAKAGVEALARTLAYQLAPAGVTVNCVAPGYTRKDATGHSAISSDAWQKAASAHPMGRLGTPDDTAAVIQFLLSREAGFVTGQVIRVDGGMNLY
ncbi:MAG: SDR family oxidoreductase [Rhodospirillales bacterium]|nr:SDR family oxidoreductase [Rhodospirillales bacterium]